MTICYKLDMKRTYLVNKKYSMKNKKHFSSRDDYLTLQAITAQL